MALFTRENVALIKNIGDTAASRIERVVADGVRRGQSTKAIQAVIKDEMGICERRAKLIAVDQIGKFNGQLTRIMQQDAGISKYIWRGMMDARERASHIALEGQIFSWSNPPSMGHPGEPIRCRCYAEPVFD
jgi:SPP1 gp7 family putative phage head morphogenesis protein